jgi:integration host factor subunit beta
MIKSELITKLSEKTNLNKQDAERVVTTVFDEISKALIKGNRVELRGFGVLSVRSRQSRLGRNPKTGEKVQVAAKKVPFFKAGKSINDALNKKAG